MRLYEYEAKALVREEGIPTPYGRNVLSGETAREVATEIDGPVVIKAQVLFGGRGKAGGIRFAATPEDARDQANDLLSGPLRGTAVTSVLVERRLDIVSEYYVGITYDEMEKRAVVIAGRSGGVEAEEAAAGGAEFVRRHIDPFVGLQPYMARDIARRVVGGKIARFLADVISRLYRLFWNYDAGLVEINPLALTGDGGLVAADCRLEIDDDALFRQEDSTGETLGFRYGRSADGNRPNWRCGRGDRQHRSQGSRRQSRRVRRRHRLDYRRRRREPDGI